MIFHSFNPGASNQSQRHFCLLLLSQHALALDDEEELESSLAVIVAPCTGLDVLTVSCK